ncbi:MAG: disulfide bond formation protein B [Gammaproteobacteria bacterium]|nr:disulfide bond formation protein B [Gammaproteobacteria bacterium]
MNFLYSRRISFLGFLFCMALLSFAAYLQTYLGLLPCPLCVVQRLIVLIIGFIFLINSLFTPASIRGKKINSAILGVFSLLGVFVAARHVWLTLQPVGAVATCSPTLEYMFKNMAVTQTLQILFLGSDDCAKQTWHLLGLNIPEWTLIFFSAATIFSIVRYIVVKAEKHQL